MPLIRPFPGLRPAPHLAADVAAPPYDVLSSAEARVRAKDHPWSFLHVSRAEIDLPEDTDPFDPAVYHKAAENLERMIDQDVLVQDEQPCLYVYRMIMGDHRQTGLVAAVSIDACNAGRIRRHEFTRPDKEDDRVRQIDATGAQTGPVLLAFRASADVDAMLAAQTANAADADVMLDGVRHQIWTIRDTDTITRLTQAFEGMDALYIADGHHRSAAAARVAGERREENPEHTGEEPYNFFLAVMFPHDQMRIIDYNRVIRDLSSLDEDTFLQRVREAFTVEASDMAVKPGRAGEFGMYLPGRWFHLTINPGLIPPDDPVKSLDVSLLADHLIAPILGIDDPRRDVRIDFIGGSRGLEELERRVDSGEMAVAFSLFPTSMEALMAVADAGEVMPPKSTWFEPKLADGLVSHLLD
ncbi:MAG: DUF1015 family protein [Mariprofundaceae bacterium]|nr:DUF1015 family protein [Mariprofundaceae bacterium]